jgi:flagellar hook-associated protein 1 FlgK
MGLVTSALQIGKSALLAYQGGLEIISNNIANLGTEGYVRQSPRMEAMGGTYTQQGYQPGGGVALAEMRRNIDEAVNVRLRMALGDGKGAQAEHSTLVGLESLFNALSDVDLSSQMNAFFNAWADLQNAPEEQSARSLVLNQGATLSDSFRRMAQSLKSQYEAVNQQLTHTVGQINEIAADLADLNAQIVAAESSGYKPVSMLRDQRDKLLGELSEMVAIQTYEQPDGSKSVYIGNEMLVQNGMYHELTTTLEIVDGRETAILRWADNNNPVTPWGGELEGLVQGRDVHIVSQITELDELANALICDVNRLHASGQGLEGYQSLTGTCDVSDADVALNTADNGMAYLPENGSFLITVTNTTSGLQETVRIEVDLDGIGTDATLNSLAADITAAVPTLSATVRGGNRLMIEAGAGYSFTFGEDTSGVLGALGINTFFAGDDASSIGIDVNIVGQPNRVAAGTSALPGDGTNAGQIAALATSASYTLNNGRSVLDHYNATMAELATTTLAAENAVEAADVITGSLQAQWEAVSGVNLDEETLMLMRYQRAFQGAARVVTVVDELIRQVLNMTR